jgi:hypothetical protein
MSFEIDITEIKRMIEKLYAETETMPTEAPVITPQTPSQPSKPNTPIRPTPNISPKPKAMTDDTELFLQKRNLLNAEAPKQVTEATPGKNYDTSVVPADKLKWIQTGDETINKILPGLPPEQQEYLIKINSDSYTELVDRVESFTGINVTPRNVPKLIGTVLQALQEVEAIESKNKRAFEEMAIELVFSVPEFKVVEQAYMNDEISIDAKIGPAELGRLTQPEGNEEKKLEGLTTDEEANLEMAEFLDRTSDEDIKRRFANLMISGGAVGKLYLYNMAAERLKRFNPKLPALYGIISSLVHLGYWIAPTGLSKLAAQTEEMSMGSEEVIPQGDKYIIKARAVNFPYLVHELVKGFLEYLAIDPNQQGAMRKDTVEDETRDFMAGPGVYKDVISYIPNNEMELFPMIQRKITSMEPSDIRDVLAKNARGKEIMRGMIDTARTEWQKYQKDKEEYDKGF